MALWTPVRGDHDWSKARLAEGEPGLQGSRLAKGEARRETCEAPPIRHGLRRDTFPAGEGRLGWLSSGGAPLRSPRFAWGCALRHRGKRRRPPAEADGGYSCSSGHGAGTADRGVPVPSVQATTDAQPVAQANHNSKGGSRGQRPPCPARPRHASPFARRDPRKHGAPVARRAFAQVARHPHARAA